MKAENLLLLLGALFLFRSKKGGSAVGYVKQKQYREYIPYFIDQGKTALGKWAYIKHGKKSYYIVQYDDGKRHRGYYTIIDGDKIQNKPYFDLGTMSFNHAKIYLDQMSLYNGHFYKGYDTAKNMVRNYILNAG